MRSKVLLVVMLLTIVVASGSGFAADNFDGNYQWTTSGQCNGATMHNTVPFYIKENVVHYVWAASGGGEYGGIESTAPVASDGSFTLTKDSVVAGRNGFHLHVVITAKIASDGTISGQDKYNGTARDGVYDCLITITGKRA